MVYHVHVHATFIGNFTTIILLTYKQHYEIIVVGVKEESKTLQRRSMIIEHRPAATDSTVITLLAIGSRGAVTSNSVGGRNNVTSYTSTIYAAYHSFLSDVMGIF